jgi:hypothetical protein
VQERGLRYYSPTLGRWVNRDPIGEEGALGLYTFCNNHALDAIDLVGTLFKEIEAPGEPIYENLTDEGEYRANESLFCHCVNCGFGNCKSIECTLVNKPQVVLNTDPALRDLFDTLEPDPPGTVEQHERNHHEVWLNVYLPSYEHLVGLYEYTCCSNCEERKEKLLEQFKKLKKELGSWEWGEEYGGMNHGQPNIDYGKEKGGKKLQDPPQPCVVQPTF